MRVSVSVAVFGLFASLVSPQDLSNNTSPCAQVAQAVSGGAVSVPAALANACLVSVPFNQSAASHFLQSLNSTFLNFQTTTAYLKNPPASYQQPPIDLNSTLQDISSQVNKGQYSSQSGFEQDVAKMLQNTHDGHVNGLFGTVGLVFNFSDPLPVVSISEDGQKLPQLFAFDDINATLYNNQLSWQPSALKEINGMDAVHYTRQFAQTYAQANGLELNVDWNTFMYNPARYISHYLDSRGYGTRIHAHDSLNVTFANGTQASYTSQAFIKPGQAKALAKITSGQDFYNAFVALPSSSSSQPDLSALLAQACSATSPPTVSTGLSRWPLPAYPSPLAIQAGLGAGDPDSNLNGYATGYVIEEKSLAILSIPNFGMSGAYGQSFSDFMGSFLTAVKVAGATKLLLDLQGNPGGTTLDSVDAFKHLFPNVEPFGGSRLRSSPAANALGTLYSEAYETEFQQHNSCLVGLASSSPWAAQVWDNAATGQLFSSWQEMGKPYADNGDFFYQTQTFNLSNPVQDIASAGYEIYDYANRKNASAQPPFAPEDIVILTDGICASTCTLLFEFLHHQLGIRSIVIGGLPEYGPMQANGGVRGALAYDNTQIASDISRAPLISQLLSDLSNSTSPFSPSSNPSNNTSASLSPSNPTSASLSAPTSLNPGIQFSGTINLRDQVRANESFPLQFAYEAADCRIFWTRETVNNFTALWMYAAEAMWGDGTSGDGQGLCVQGSTGHPSSSSNVTWNCAVDAGSCEGPGADNGSESGSGGNGTGTNSGGGAPVTVSSAGTVVSEGGYGWVVVVAVVLGVWVL